MRPIKLLVLSTIIPMLFMGWPLISNAANDDNNEVTSDPSFPADPNASLNDSVQILGWWSIPYEYASVARYKEMKDCGFTISYSATNRSSQIVKELAFADTAGMKCMVVTDYGDPVEEVQKYMTHPSLYAYWIYDEPTCSTFASLGEGIKKIKAVDPNHICYINLLPSFVADSTLGATSYTNYLERCIKETGCDILSYDNYTASLEMLNYFYDNLEKAYKVSKEQNKPLWAFALSTAHDPYPLPSIGKLRVQQNSNLAYGCDVLQYFTYWNPTTDVWTFHEAPIKQDGSQGFAYPLVKEMNKEIQARAFVYHNAKVVNVWHLGDEIYDGCTKYTIAEGPSIVSSLEAPSGACVSYMQKNGWDYLMIVNRNDATNAKYTNKLSITFNREVERIDTEGKFTYLTKYNNQTMEAGEAVIFGWQDKSTGIENVQDEHLKVFPNPATSEINVTGTNGKYSIINASSGSVVMQAEGTTADVSALAPGVYIVKAGAKTSRFIKR
jgi:hypothetical protein